MLYSGNSSAHAQLQNYLASGDIMRSESLRHADHPCKPLDNELYGEPRYQVESTGAILTLSASVQLLYFYCSRLPSDGYFKPYPRFSIDKDLGQCTLHLPTSCPIKTLTIHGDVRSLKQLASLEACKQLHKVGALTDNLVPDIVKEEKVQQIGFEPDHEHGKYYPPELVGSCGNHPEKFYHYYLIELRRNFEYDIQLQDVVLAVHTRLDRDLETLDIDLDVDRGKLTVGLRYIGHDVLTSWKVHLCRKFQVTLFRVLLDHNLKNLIESLGQIPEEVGPAFFDYLLLPCVKLHQNVSIDWKCIGSVLNSRNSRLAEHTDRFPSSCCGHAVHTYDGLVCRCMLENSLVCTPHNGYLYCISGVMDGFNCNTLLELNTGESVTYKDYFKQRHGIKLVNEGQTLLNGKHMFTVQNFLQRCKSQQSNEPSNRSSELPPELCMIVMSPISVSTFYSFSFLPSIMHRIESLLIASNLRRMHSLYSPSNVVIPTIKVLEAITTRNCQEKLNLESLETLGDSFLKYASSQYLFKTHQNQHEGLLSIKRERMVCNAALCKLGCERKITGFIRDEQFEPKKWIIPGCKLLSSEKVYRGGNRKLKSKRIADVIEALIGAFLSAGGESVASSFMAWIGIKIDLVAIPYMRTFPGDPERLVNVKYLESLLNYSFKDATLLVEALTHGSFMLPEVPQCYQRLEFLGDAVLDHLITVHLFEKYSGPSPELLTDLRSATVNNDCYAQAAFKKDLYKHIRHTSQELYRQINVVRNSDQASSVSAFSWESKNTYPKVLGDVIESLAGAIYVDSGYNKDIVFQSIRPLLEPLITPETLTPHPVKELTELCQREHYIIKKPSVSREKGTACVTVEVVANGIVYKESSSVADKKTAKKLASMAVLKSLKDRTASNARSR